MKKAGLKKLVFLYKEILKLDEWTFCINEIRKK